MPAKRYLRGNLDDSDTARRSSSLTKFSSPLIMINAVARNGDRFLYTNIAIMLLATLLIWTVGIIPFLLIHLPIVLIAGSAGVWLFYVQHQFEDTHWSRPPDWKLPHAAMHGSSHYDLPRPLRWITGNIGMHHVHHLSSRVPFYRLPEVLRDHPELAEVGRISLRDSLGCVKLILWDEATQ